MFFRCFFCTVRLSIFERFVFASFEPLRFCKKVRFVFPDLLSGIVVLLCFFRIRFYQSFARERIFGCLYSRVSRWKSEVGAQA